ncbi:MAG: type II toxin-antitoxin system VapC family toxin [Kiritimatiellia bacterium]|jgi:hypothetical protein|nr:type II toxin-antitoxin system VapC family toxin [Kiritimatiellia bacterium]
MITAVDTSVLIDVFTNDPTHGHASATVLRRCLQEGTLTACDVVWAETRAVFADDAAFEAAMRTLGVKFSALTERSAADAGSRWKRYRASGGKRVRVMADFLIGAHSLHQSERLLTRDRGYYRKHFKDLSLLTP